MRALCLVIGSALLSACTTVPSRFNTTDPIVENCGYIVEADRADSFSLEVAYKEYKFLPTPDPVIVAARSCFTATAQALAKRQNRTIAPLAAADMHATANRNITDGNYLVHVTGRVFFSTP